MSSPESPLRRTEGTVAANSSLLRSIWRIGGQVAGFVLPLAVSAALTAGLLLLLHISPGGAATALLNGALGNPYSIGVTFTKATPILLAGLGVIIAFRGRFWNIGAEGQIYMGGLAAALVGIYVPLPPIIHPLAALVAGFIGGAAWALLAGALRVWRRVNEVVSTLLLNTVAIYFIGWLVSGPIKEQSAGYPRSTNIMDTAHLGIILPGSRLHAGVLVALMATAVLAWLIARTRFGFRVRLLGANDRALRYTGVATGRTLLQVVVMSGGLAGLAGAVEVLGVHYRLPAGFSPGYGYDAITVALLAQLNPLGAAASALFIGLLRAGADAMQRAVGAPSALVFFVQGLAVLAALVGMRLLRHKRRVTTDGGEGP